MSVLPGNGVQRKEIKLNLKQQLGFALQNYPQSYKRSKFLNKRIPHPNSVVHKIKNSTAKRKRVKK